MKNTKLIPNIWIAKVHYLTTGILIILFIAFLISTGCSTGRQVTRHPYPNTLHTELVPGNKRYHKPKKYDHPIKMPKKPKSYASN